ncbi:MAG: mtnB 2, partial [Hyphomicrobiales bacterium]|nr:mtnB 2 [Hyphomicrobiales bacterium]
MSQNNDPRQQLVDCIRMLEKADIVDHNGHVSIRYGENLLINNGAAVKGLLTQDDLVEIDMDGNVVSGKGK